MKTQPNILWICTDQQRHDTVAALGNAHIRTPALDRLCDLGVAFTQAYCQAPVCTPSRASFMTGRYPSTTHVFRNDAGPYPSGEVPVASKFRKAGYRTGLVGKLHLSNAKWKERRPDDDGYEEFYRSQSGGRRPEHDHDDYARWLVQQGTTAAKLRESCAPILGDGFPAALHQNHWMGETAIDFLTRHRDEPWFLSLHPYDPHHPLDPAPEFHRRYDHTTLPHARFAPHELDYQKKYAQLDQQRPIPISPTGECDHPGGPNDHPFIREHPVYEVPLPYDSRKVKAAYYAQIEHVDHEVGRILDALERTGQLEDTIVIFHSDHGEHLGDHGLLYKGCRFYESLVHVPLIVAWPRHIPGDRRCDDLVELVDLVPTLMELLGWPVGEEIQGRSLVPRLTGEGALRPKRHVVSFFNDSLDMWDKSHATMSFDGRYKLVTYHNHVELTELFDLQDDPDEFHNIWNEVSGAEQALRLRSHLDALMRTVWAGAPRLTQADFADVT